MPSSRPKKQRIASTKNALASFALPSALTIETVEGLAAELAEVDFKAPRATLNASRTETITTPGIQLLIALAKTLEARGIALAITAANPSVMHTFAQLGLAALFSQWEVLSD
jgi:anti-anti-sigma regulatory factor